MTKATMKSLLMTAAMSGLLTGATTTLAASTSTNSSAPGSISRALGLSASSSFDDQKTEKHACKGQNSCKGKGGCATDGSKPKAV